MWLVLAIAAVVSGAAVATLWGTSGASFGLVAALTGGAAGFALVRPQIARASGPERYAPLALLVFFVPCFTMAVAPGADMAMHVALARGLVEGGLSPAWPSAHPLLYPRGFSALVALLSPLGYAKAGLVAAGLAYVVFWAGLAEVLDRLGAPSPRTLAALCTLASPLPQQFFGWGGNPTALALGLGMLAAARLHRPAVAALFLAGATAVHPLGAAAACLVVGGVAWTARRPGAAAIPLAAFAAVSLALQLRGPALSTSEARWIADYARTQEALPWGATAGGMLAGCALALLPRTRRAGVLLALLSAALFVAPWTGVYAVRVAPLVCIPAALLLSALPRRALIGVVALAAVVHVRVFQRATPIATAHDLEAIACAARVTPRDAVIDGAYGDATQWIPALAGRAVTHPHVHVALFDETAGALPTGAAFRFTGERLRYGAPLPPASGPELCRAGGASLIALPR